MEIEKTIFDERPSMLVSEGDMLRINFDVEGVDIKLNTSSEGKAKVKEAFAAYVVRLPQPIGYDKVVDAIVSAAYPADKMQAIINNHLFDGDDDSEHAEEFKEMQEWRKRAKTWAKEAMAEYMESIK